MLSKERGQQKKFIGTVFSDRAEKTRSIIVEQIKRDPLYGKYLRVKTKFIAHDPDNTTRSGDRVEIVSCRPLSKLKRWRITRIIQRANPMEDMGHQEVME
jgi:small subunit ribosomal protein S17